MIQPNMDPLHKFQYTQVSNAAFNLVLLNQDLRALHTPVMCKDYFQDIYWSEKTRGKGSIYGLVWEPGRFDAGAPRQYMAITWANPLIQLQKPLQRWINAFDSAQGFTPAVVHATPSDKMIVLEFDQGWVSNGPMISALTSLIRLCGEFTEDGDPAAYLAYLRKPKLDAKYRWLKEPAYPWMKPDLQRMPDTSDGGGVQGRRLLALLQGQRSTNLWTDNKTMTQAHTFGIMGVTSFPEGK